MFSFCLQPLDPGRSQHNADHSTDCMITADVYKAMAMTSHRACILPLHAPLAQSTRCVSFLALRSSQVSIPNCDLSSCDMFFQSCFSVSAFMPAGLFKRYNCNGRKGGGPSWPTFS